MPFALLIPTMVLSFTSAAVEKPGKSLTARAAYLCEALMTKRGPSSEPRPLETYRARLAEVHRRHAAGQSMPKQGRLILGTNRLINTIGRLTGKSLLVHDEVVGESNIKTYLRRATEAANGLEAAHVAAEACRPFEVKPVLLTHLAQTAVSLILTNLGAYFTLDFAHSGHPILAAISAVAMFKVVQTSLVPYGAAVIQDLRNGWILRRAGRGGTIKGPTSADLRVERFDSFAETVSRELTARPPGKTLTPFWFRSRVALPLSRSNVRRYLGKTDALTADRIAESIRRSGDFTMPADPYLVELNFVFFEDPESNRPVLLVLGH